MENGNVKKVMKSQSGRRSKTSTSLSLERLCHNDGNAMFVILNEVKNLMTSGSYETEILRPMPQNDIGTQLRGGREKGAIERNEGRRQSIEKEFYEYRGIHEHRRFFGDNSGCLCHPSPGPSPPRGGGR
jgi:hypothetical protein